MRGIVPNGGDGIVEGGAGDRLRAVLADAERQVQPPRDRVRGGRPDAGVAEVRHRPAAATRTTGRGACAA